MDIIKNIYDGRYDRHYVCRLVYKSPRLLRLVVSLSQDEAETGHKVVIDKGRREHVLKTFVRPFDPTLDVFNVGLIDVERLDKDGSKVRLDVSLVESKRSLSRGVVGQRTVMDLLRQRWRKRREIILSFFIAY